MAGTEHRLRHRIGRRRRRLLWLLVAPVAALGIVIAIDRAFFAPRRCMRAPSSARSRRARGCSKFSTTWSPVQSSVAPGATAYVSGPHGTWAGAAGVADTGACTRMQADARMRLESVTKIYTATLILQLAQAGELRVGDTVARWLPGLLPYGKQVTIRELLTMSSGLIDNNDFNNASDNVKERLSRPRQGREATRAAARDRRPRQEEPCGRRPGDVVGQVGRLAAAALPAGPRLPLLEHRLRHPRPDRRPRSRQAPARALPGADLRAARPPRDHLRPAGADQRRPCARLWNRARRGEVDATDWHWGVGAEGGIVSSAQDTATFLTALMRGKLLDRKQRALMETDDLWLGGVPSTCADQVYGWSGGGSGYKTDVWVDDGGSRVAVLLLNARHYDTAQPAADTAAHTALQNLYCSA